MQRYQPPHQRHLGSSTQLPPRSDVARDPRSSPSFEIRDGPFTGPGGYASRGSYGNSSRGSYSSVSRESFGNVSQAGGGREGWTPRQSYTYRSKKDWSAPALASPASDLRPMRSGTPGRRGGDDMDDMEMMQSVSRSGGDGAEGDALKDWGTQERYRVYIDERITKHNATFGTALNSVPSADAVDELQSLKSIVLLLRKLREGVVASHRIDEFAIDVFETSVRLSILARDPPQLISSLSGLVPGLYIAVDDRKGKGKASDPTDQLESSLATLALDASSSTGGASSSTRNFSDRRVEFASILLLYQLAHGDSYRTFFATMQSLINPSRTTLRRPFDSLAPAPNSSGPSEWSDPPAAFCHRHDLWFAVRASRALVEGIFNPLLYFSLLSHPKASSYERAVLSWAEAKVRKRAWAVMQKAYLECSLDWVGSWIGKEEGVASWVEVEGGKVVECRVVMR